MKTSESIDKLAPALQKAQAEMLPLVKDSSNPFFKSKYADLHSVTSACYPALQDNGFSVVQSNAKDGDTLIVTTRLQHSSGQWMDTECVIPTVKADAQAYGSSYTYGRRYGLQAAVGLAPEDDDGNHATASQQAAKKPAKSAPQTQPASKGKAAAEKLAQKLSDGKDAKWFELKPFTKGPFAGMELADVVCEGDNGLKAIKQVLDYIDEYVLDYPVAAQRLKDAIAEAESIKAEQEQSQKGDK